MMALLTLLPYLLLLLLSLFLLFLFSTKNTINNNNNKKLPPGPCNLPIIGNLHMLSELSHHSLCHLSQKYGPLMYLKLGSIPTIVASSAATVRDILKTHDLETCSRPLLTSLYRLSYGFSDIATSPYGDQWRELRKVSIVQLFSARKVASFRTVREEEVDKLIESITTTSTNYHATKTVNLSEMLILLANNITCTTALGKRYYGEEGGVLIRMLLETQAMFAGFFFADYMPGLGWMDRFTGMRARLEKNFLELDEFYQRVIDEHVGRDGEYEVEHEDTIDVLLRSQKEGSHITSDHIKGVLMNILIGGSDTSSAAVEWAMAELMRNPQAMEKAQDEVRGIIGSKGKVEESDLPKLHYFKCVVKEVMRLHPPAPLLVHRETMKHCLVGGYDVPAKTRLIINAWAVARDPKAWERPEEFWPERFIDSPIDMKGRDFELIPFGAGRRICPGMHSGLVVVEVTLANLLYSFDWKLPEGMSKEDINMDEAPGITVHRKSALHLVAIKYDKMN